MTTLADRPTDTIDGTSCPPGATAVDTMHRWRSGPCRALQHAFDLELPATPEFIADLGPIVRPFQQREVTGGTAASHYEVVPSTAGPLPWDFRHNGDRLASGRCARDFATMLAWHVNRSVIKKSTPHHVLMHGACVVRAGITVILPADQESGKTTTTAGLLRCGYTYVTDEAVALDPESGAVTPFPKTLSLDPGSWPLFAELRHPHDKPWARQWHVPPEHLGATSATAPVASPSVVVIPHYERGARTQVHPLSSGEALRALSLLTFTFTDDVARNLRVLARLVTRATVVRLTIGTLDGAVDAIDQLVSDKILERL